MIQLLKKSWAALAFLIVLGSCLVTVKNSAPNKIKSENTIVVDRLVNTLVC